MAPERIKYNLDIGKIIAGLLTCASVVWYAGKLDERLARVSEDVKDIKAYIYPQNFQAELNRERAQKNRYAPVKNGE